MGVCYMAYLRKRYAIWRHHIYRLLWIGTTAQGTERALLRYFHEDKQFWVDKSEVKLIASEEVAPLVDDSTD